MSRSFRIDDTLANKISFYHIMLLMASLPFDRFYSHLILISYAIHTLIQLRKGTIKPIIKWRTLVLQSVFWVTALSTIYSTNQAGAFDEWGKHLIIFLIPVLFCLNPFDLNKYRSLLLYSFAMVITAAIIYLYADALVTIRHYQLPLKALFSDAFTNHNFSEPLDIHATFFSMQVTIALVYLLSRLLTEKRLLKRLFYLLCSLILAAGLIQLSSKAIFIVLVIVVLIAVPLFLLQGNRRLRFIGISGGLLIVVVIAILNSSTFRERYISELKTDLEPKQKNENLDSRLSRWNVSMGLVRESPVIGHGAGTEIGLLQDAFFKHKLYSSYLNKLNTHSQYISFLIKSGAIGLLIYIVTLTFGFRTSLQQRDLLFFTFMMLVAVVSVSENLLDVDKGVCFYGFFFSFFLFSDEGKATNETVLKQV